MKKIALAAMIALSLAGCGILPTSSATSATTSTESSLLSIMGLEDSEAATESVDPEENRMGPGQLLFALLDADGDERVTLEEMSTALAKHATIGASQLAELFDKMDKNGDGSIVLSELQPERRIEHRKPPRMGHGRHGRPEGMGDRRPPMDEEGFGEEE